MLMWNLMLEERETKNLLTLVAVVTAGARVDRA